MKAYYLLHESTVTMGKKIPTRLLQHENPMSFLYHENQNTLLHHGCDVADQEWCLMCQSCLPNVQVSHICVWTQGRDFIDVKGRGVVKKALTWARLATARVWRGQGFALV
jgi:hypothetical protein